MTTTSAQLPENSDDFDKDIDELVFLSEPDGPDAVSVHAVVNTGQQAGVVYGGMHQNTTIVNRIRSLRRPHALEAEYINEIVETFVDRTFQPYGCADTDSRGVLEILKARHAIVLAGEAGAGRHTSAVAVLSRLGLSLQELPAWDPAQPDQFDLADLPPESGRGYLLVLPDAGSPPAGLARQLSGYREELAPAGSYLVVVTTAATWNAAEGFRNESVITVGFPGRTELLARRVGFQRPAIDLRPVLAAPEIAALAQATSPRDTVRLADLVVAQADISGNDPHTDEGRDAFITSVVSAYQEWEADLSEWFRQYRDAGDRLFLIASAVLEGRPAGLILQSAESLGTRLGGKPADAQGIAAPGVRELAQNIKAHLRPDGRLSFPRPAYADAVIDFVLKDRSDAFRRTLQRWMAQLPRTGRRAEDATLADTVADVALRLVLRHGDTSFVYPIMAGWKGQPGLRPVLVDLLTAVALSEEGGASMRNQLYHWARRTEPDLVRVVAEVCAGDLADAYPRIALTRINSLASRAAAAVISDVVTAVVRMWERPALRRDVLHRVVGWLGDPGTPAFEVGCRVLIKLASGHDPSADPLRVAFIQSPEDSNGLSKALGNVLNRDLSEELRDILFGWFDVAASDQDFGDRLVEALAGAVPGPGSALRVSRIRVLADKWHSDDITPAQEALRERLIQRLQRSDPMIQSWIAAMAEGRATVHHVHQQIL